MNEAWYTTAFGAHYPLLYAHRDQAEARRCLQLLPRLAPFPETSPLLDLGCGDGRHLHQLAETGRQVVGIDLSPHLLAVARRSSGGPKAQLVRGDMRFLPLSTGALGGVLSLFTAFGYFGDLAGNQPVVREVARVLKPGGHWYLDYVDCDGVRRELQGKPAVVRTRELGPFAVRESRQLCGDGTRVEKLVELTPLAGQEKAAREHGVDAKGLTYTESVALFDLRDMAALGQSCGLALLATAGSYEGAPLGDGTRWIMVFHKDPKLLSAPSGGGM